MVTWNRDIRPAPTDMPHPWARWIEEAFNLLTSDDDNNIVGNITVIEETVTNTIIVNETITLGAFTEGSVLFAGVDGVVSEDNANFFWDDGNNYLGLLTNTPAFPLDVNGTARIVNVLQVDDPVYWTGETTLPTAVTGYVEFKTTNTRLYLARSNGSSGGNDFTGDGDIIALWNMDDGAITVDSTANNNTLGNVGVVENDTTNYRQGDASALFTLDAQVLSINDADVSAEFPLKSGTSNKIYTITFWIRITSLNQTPGYIFTKGTFGTDKSFGFHFDYQDPKLRGFSAYGPAGNWSQVEYWNVDEEMVFNQWYHVGITFDDSIKTLTCRIWDDTAQALLTANYTKVFSNNINVSAVQYRMGDPVQADRFLGNLDEFTVWKTVKTSDEIDQIREGYYPTGSGWDPILTESSPDMNPEFGDTIITGELDVSSTLDVTGLINAGSHIVLLDDNWVGSGVNTAWQFHDDVEHVTTAAFIGIGIISPTVALDVNGDIQTTGDIVFNSSGNMLDMNVNFIRDTRWFEWTTSTVAFYLDTVNGAGNETLTFWANDVPGSSPTQFAQIGNGVSATYQTYFNGGNVGINQALPTQKLEVVGNIKVSNGSWVGESVDCSWLFNGTSDYITTTAWVGIGTTTPINALDVPEVFQVDTASDTLLIGTQHAVFGSGSNKVYMGGFAGANDVSNNNCFGLGNFALWKAESVGNSIALGVNCFKTVVTGGEFTGAGGACCDLLVGGGSISGFGWYAGHGLTGSKFNVTCLGAHAGRYTNLSNKIIIDNRNRSTAAGELAGAIMYAHTNATVANQYMYLNGEIRGTVGAKIGDGGTTDYTTIEADGTIEFNGAATVWNDVQFQISSGKVGVANNPTWATLTANTSEYAFDVGDYIDMACNELEHSWREGQAGHIHAHVSLEVANATGSSRYAQFTVYIAKPDASDLWIEVSLTAELEIPDGSSALENFYLDMGDVVLTGLVIGKQTKVRIERIAATGGTEYADDIFIHQVGMHLENDTVGSRTEAAK